MVNMFLPTVRTVLGRFLPPTLHQRLMAFHAEDPLRRPGVFEIFNLLLAVPTSKTCCAKGLIAGEDGQILDFVPTGAAAICTVVADERAVAEEEEVCIRVEESAASVAAEAVNMPTIARWEPVSISIL